MPGLRLVPLALSAAFAVPVAFGTTFGSTASAAEPIDEVRPPTWDMSLEELQAIGLGQSRGNPVPALPGAPSTVNGQPPSGAIEPAGTIFVNFDGAMLMSGPDDSHTNTTQLFELAGAFAPYGDNEAKRAAVMEAVRLDWSGLNIAIVDQRPATGDYTMNMTGPTNPYGGGVLGIAPVDCRDQMTHNNITFAFHSADDMFDAAITATTIGQEVAHSFGLEHVDEPGDIMNPYNAGGDPRFRDECIAIVGGSLCTEQHLEFCPDGVGQNAFRELLELFGPAIVDMAPPTVVITSPTTGTYFPTGSSFEVTVNAQDDSGIESVQLFNMGSPLQRDEDAPYGWSVNNVPASTFLLHVVATDLAGNTATSNVVEIIVADEPPEVDGTEGDTEGEGENSDDEGCGCRTTAPAPAALSLLLLVALGRRRCRAQPSVHT